MAQSTDLGEAQIILLATQFISESNFTQLQLLVSEQRQILSPRLLYRQLLTYLPLDPESVTGLIAFLNHLESNFRDVSNLDGTLDKSSVKDISSRDLKRRFHELRLESEDQFNAALYDDDLSVFVVKWLQRLETLLGMPAVAQQLVRPFIAGRPQLGLWQDSYLIPLLKLQNIFYPGRAESITSRSLEDSHGIVGVKTLLQFAEQDGRKAFIGRDLDEVVAPWVRGASRSKRRRLSGSTTSLAETSWGNVNEWIYETSYTDFHLAAKAFLEWNGPNDTREPDDNPSGLGDSTNSILHYVQAGLALITTSTDTGDEINILLRQLLDRAISISTHASFNNVSTTTRALSEATKADLLQNSILQANNPITLPFDENLLFLEKCLFTQKLLNQYKLPFSIGVLVEIALFGSKEKQEQELLHILQQVPRLTRSEIDWPLVRHHLISLQSGQDIAESNFSETTKYPFLGRVSIDFLESKLLDALVANAQYTSVKQIYLEVQEHPLQTEEVQQHVVSAIYEAYDNASNGNRTRGGMKRAYDIMNAFQPDFAKSEAFTHIHHLIRATHSLSFYHLTLQHGVPFQPATIRAHEDPVSLIDKVLAQNHKAFAKLDDLIEIGRDLVRAGLPNATDTAWSSKSIEERLFDTQHRITYLAITSALADHDFDTAYSYITTRLATSPTQTSELPFTDDTSWRAAYAAGKYRPSASPRSVHDRITGLSKRMDLLSLALTLTPTPDSLSEILATWRRCEEEMDGLRSQAVEEERAVEKRIGADSALPGGFEEDREMDAAETRRMMERRALGGSGPSYEEDAPMGLFDVARGAASAFKKSAFPLRGASGGQATVRDEGEQESGSGRTSLDERRASGEYGRVRKRDMVSNMVTGGFVSGMSWVLGAQPANSGDER